MNKKEKIVLIGGGGHCKSVIDVIESAGIFEIEGIIDTPDKVNSKILNYKIIGTDDDLQKITRKIKNFHITVGHIKTPAIRIKLYNLIEKLNGNLPIIVAKDAHISKYTKIGKGTVVMHFAMINADAKVGNNCIINNKALIEHDCNIGNNCHISTGAIINGTCKIGDNCFIGSNAVIKNNISITDNVIIGAGSVVISDIAESGIYVGNPVKKLINKTK